MKENIKKKKKYRLRLRHNSKFEVEWCRVFWQSSKKKKNSNNKFFFNQKN